MVITKEEFKEGILKCSIDSGIYHKVCVDKRFLCDNGHQLQHETSDINKLSRADLMHLETKMTCRAGNVVCRESRLKLDIDTLSKDYEKN